MTAMESQYISLENKAASPAVFSSNIDPFLKNMDLRDATRLLRRRMKLIVGVIISFCVLSLLAALLLTPQYRASTQIMLDARKTSVVDMGAVVSGLPSDNMALRSEMNIIMSRAVIDRVVNKLKLIDDREMLPQKWWKVLNPFSWFETKLFDEEQAARDRSVVANNITKSLNVTNDGRSFSIEIAFDSEEPVKAARIANAFADEYLVDQLEAKYDATTRASKWLNTRLGSLKQQVETAEQAVEEFRQKTKMIEIEGTTVSARQMGDINSQLTKTRGETSQAEARLRSIQNMLQSKAGIDGAADVLASPLIQRLREQEAEVRRREAELSSRYGELHPKMVNALAEYRDLQNKIAEEVRKVVVSLENEVEISRAKEDQLKQDLQDLESRAGVELKDSVILRQLQREAEANRTLYQSFLNRFKQTTEQQDLQIADSRIIARADVPITPAFPSKLLFMLVGTLLGSIVGILLAYLIEYFDRGFRSISQIEELINLPVVGQIPSLTKISSRPPEDYVVDKPLSSYSEALRTVRTAIHFSNVDNPPKVVMVTSAVPGEGKTTFCLSLARSLARAGNKILLIDADMRRPRIAEVSGVADFGGGLSALLTGEKSFAQVKKPDPIVLGLDVIPSVGKTPNAQDLLGSQQMHKILQKAAKHYDLVIVDTPPILAVSDASMVAHLADTTIFLVRWATTPRDTMVQALKQLSSSGCKIAGVVMTQVDITEQAKYGDGYHSYNYSYNEYYAD